ncbi:MAG TPA: hypothetical protein VL993_09805 [Stellaceae bacterium]|nr:hypothetical protein [Stellaceae bacterium]
MTDPNGSLELRIGRLEGRVHAIGEQVEAMDQKLDRLVAWTSERTGAEQESARHQHHREATGSARMTLVVGVVSGVVSMAANFLMAKTHWPHP